MITHNKKKVDRKAFNWFVGCGCDRVIDLGCGEGRFMSLDPAMICGIDQNIESVRICRKKDFLTYYGSALDLPFSSPIFGGVHCCHVIEHLSPIKAYKLLKEVDRVLKPGGLFILRTPLLYPGFYNDLTHVKPYYPRSIIRYFVKSKGNRTLKLISSDYEVLSLEYRFSLKLMRRTGYMLVLRKKHKDF